MKYPAVREVVGLWLAAICFAACAPATLVRQVEFPVEPTAVEGFRRTRTVSVDMVDFEPQTATGEGSESWPTETLSTVENRLRADLSAQPWLGRVVDKNADWRTQLECTYQADLEARSPWLVLVPALGATIAGVGGYMVGATDSKPAGTALLISGTVALMIGGISMAGLTDPPTVNSQSMACKARFQDRSDRVIMESDHSLEGTSSKTLSEFIMATEDKMFSEIRDALTRIAASAGKKFETVAVLDITAPKVLDDAQRAMITKLVASELQRHGVGRVIGMDDIRALLSFDKMKMLVGCNDESCLAEVGGALGVEWLVAGSVGLVGGTYVLELRLLNAHNTAVERRTTHSGSTLERLLGVIPEMAEELVSD